jgi:hypothetical protein
MKYTIYKKSNGEIVSQFGGSLEILNLNLDSETQDYIEGTYLREKYYINNGTPVEITAQPESWYEFNYDTKEWVENEEVAKERCLEKRKQLLLDSDWTQLPNGPFTSEQQTAWATYRQALRDVTEQAGYPLNVTWPQKPTANETVYQVGSM